MCRDLAGNKLYPAIDIDQFQFMVNGEIESGPEWADIPVSGLETEIFSLAFMFASVLGLETKINFH